MEGGANLGSSDMKIYHETLLQLSKVLQYGMSIGNFSPWCSIEIKNEWQEGTKKQMNHIRDEMEFIFESYRREGNLKLSKVKLGGGKFEKLVFKDNETDIIDLIGDGPITRVLDVHDLIRVYHSIKIGNSDSLINYYNQFDMIEGDPIPVGHKLYDLLYPLINDDREHVMQVIEEMLNSLKMHVKLLDDIPSLLEDIGFSFNSYIDAVLPGVSNAMDNVIVAHPFRTRHDTPIRKAIFTYYTLSKVLTPMYREDFVISKVYNQINGLEGNGPSNGNDRAKMLRNRNENMESDDTRDLNRIAPIPIKAIQSFFDDNRGGNVLIVKSKTGTGKSTQIPGLFMESTNEWSNKRAKDRKRIICTQPRIANAEGLADYVPKEYGIFNGEMVIAQHAGGVNKTDKDTTQLVYMTEDTLLHLFKSTDRLDKEYKAIIVDEVHERNLGTDLLMAEIKRHLDETGDSTLNVVITSATIDPNAYAKYFGVFTSNDVRSTKTNKSVIENSQFNSFIVPSDYDSFKKIPIPLEYSDTIGKETLNADLKSQLDMIISNKDSLVLSLGKHETDDYTIDGAALCLKIHENTPVTDNHDILFFVPSSAAINKVKSILESTVTSEPFKVFPFNRQTYAGMTPDERDFIKSGQITDPKNREFSLNHNGVSAKRKIILGTDITETGVTIKTLRYVVDSGIRNAVIYHPIFNASVIEQVRISGNSMEQRMGRVGRVSDGYYYPLFSMATLKEMNDEKHRTNPESIVVQAFPEHMLYLIQAYQKQKGFPVGSKGIVPFNIYNRDHFHLMTYPSPEIVSSAINVLHQLGSIDHNLLLTKLGDYMTNLSLKPEYAHMMISSAYHRCTLDMASIIAMVITDPSTIFTSVFDITEVIFDTTEETIERQYRMDYTGVLNERTKKELGLESDGKVYNVVSDIVDLNILDYQSDHLSLLYIYNRFKQSGGSIEWCQRYGIAFDRMLEVERRRTEILERYINLGLSVVTETTNDPSIYYNNILECICYSLRYNSAVRSSNDTRYMLESMKQLASIRKPLFIKDDSIISRSWNNNIKGYPDRVVYEQLSCTQSGFTGEYRFQMSLVTAIPPGVPDNFISMHSPIMNEK